MNIFFNDTTKKIATILLIAAAGITCATEKQKQHKEERAKFFWEEEERASKAEYPGTFVYFGAFKPDVRFRKGFGKDILPSKGVGFNVGSNIQLYKFLYFDFGIDFLTKQTKTFTLQPGDLLPGQVVSNIAAGEWEKWKSSFTSIGVLTGMSIIYNLNLDDDFNFKIMGSAGIVIAAVESRIEFVDDELPGLPSNATIEARSRDYSEVETIPSAGVGLQMDYKNMVGVRVNYKYKNYSLFDNIKSDQMTAHNKLKMQDAHELSVNLILAI